MEEKHRNLLRTNRMAICLFPFDADLLAEKLQQKKVLFETDKNFIYSEKDDLKKKEKLLDILQKRGPSAYSNFLDALDDIGIKNIRSLLNGNITTAELQTISNKHSGKLPDSTKQP